jgi:hypothetical protein
MIPAANGDGACRRSTTVDGFDAALPQRQDGADGGWPSLLPRAPAGMVGMGRRFDPAGDLHG